jgi:two-component system sensor histidine kinase/response regulator
MGECLDAEMDDQLVEPPASEALDGVVERWLGPAPAAPIGVIDESRMRTFQDDYPDIVGQLVDLFLTSTPALLDELRVAAAGGDVDELRRTAHQLKGSCEHIGATLMATLCRSIEGGEGDATASVEELAAALQPTETAIRNALAS